MTFQDRVNSFVELGLCLKGIDQTTHPQIFTEANLKNPWFTYENIELALSSLAQMLEVDGLQTWLGGYDGLSDPHRKSKNVGVIMAGNLPAVGFHDMLCVLISGHRLLAKTSAQDDVLPKFLMQLLQKINPEWAQNIEFVSLLKNTDAVISTGSDNSARYFSYYFSKIPHIIRKNRSSLAILSGNETSADLNLLGKDIFNYFGLGCRNVSKILVPAKAGFTYVIDGLQPYSSIIDHHKYANNYMYNKTLLTMNMEPYLDNNFALFCQKEALNSPISVIHYDFYNDLNEAVAYIKNHNEKIQCVVGGSLEGLTTVPLGFAQQPKIHDYADGVDTMEFLLAL